MKPSREACVLDLKRRHEPSGMLGTRQQASSGKSWRAIDPGLAYPFSGSGCTVNVFKDVFAPTGAASPLTDPLSSSITHFNRKLAERRNATSYRQHILAKNGLTAELTWNKVRLSSMNKIYFANPITPLSAASAPQEMRRGTCVRTSENHSPLPGRFSTLTFQKG